MRNLNGNNAIPSPVASVEKIQTANFLNLIPSLVAYIDKDLRYQYVNPAYENWIGMDADSIIGKTVSQLFGEDMFNYLEPHIDLVLSGKPSRFENKLYNNDGLRFLDICLTPDFDSHKRVKGYLEHINDITDKNKVENELKDYVETASIGLHWVNADGIIVWVNQAELNMLGYKKEEYIGHHISEFYIDQSVISDILKRLSSKETLRQYEAELKCKDGSPRHVMINSSVLWDDGKFIHSRCFTVDITERKRAEQALKESESQYKELLKSLSIAVYTCDAEGRVKLFNEAAVRLWGSEPEVGKDMWHGSWKIFSPINGAPIPLDTCPMAVTLKERRPVSGVEIVVERPDGTQRTIIPNPRPLFDASGKMTGAVNMLIDVTDQKLAAQAIRESEERFKAIADLAPIVIWMSDEQGNYTYLNSRWAEFTGRKSSDGYGNSWMSLIHPDDTQMARDEFMNAIAAEKTYSSKFRYLNAKGNYTMHQANGTVRFNEEGKFVGFIGILQNIEHQEQKSLDYIKQLKQKNEDLRQSEERYHRMIDEVQDYAIILLDDEGDIVNWNAGAKFIKGYSPDEIVGRNFRVFYTSEDREKKLPETLLAQARTTGKASHEGWRVKKDGTRFWGNITITAIHDTQKKLIGFSKVTRDLTEKKAAEDALKEKNRELEKMNQELSSFAYVSSHDLQEPLRKIQTFSTRILDLEQNKFSEKGKDYFNRIQTAAHRMRALIEDLLLYSRTNTAERKFSLTDLNSLLQDVRNEISERIEEKNATLECSSLPQLNVIPFQFHQLMANILNNALKFSKKDIAPRILIKAEIVAGSQIQSSRKDLRKSYHHISVSDNGIGFEPEYSTRIFEVFQRLHGRNEYEGTGVGLAICKKIVEIHGGTITAEGKVDEGATFHIYLPADTEN